MGKRSGNEERAKRIEQYYISHGKDKKKTYDHFMDEGISKKIIYYIIHRHDTMGEVTYKKPTGRRISVTTPETFDRVAKFFKDNPQLSLTDASKSLNITRASISRIIAKMKENNMETYKTTDSEPRCPTCHQKIDPQKAQILKSKRRSKSKSNEIENTYEFEG